MHDKNLFKVIAILNLENALKSLKMSHLYKPKNCFNITSLPFQNQSPGTDVMLISKAERNFSNKCPIMLMHYVNIALEKSFAYALWA